jgi:glycerophosphoryl diester phosphodiesterase
VLLLMRERTDVAARDGAYRAAVAPSSLILAHRGANHAAPENTLPAFAAARSHGADGVELDVRRSADGELVIRHDAAIEGFGLIGERSFAELRGAHPEVPTLAEALDVLEGMLVNIEVKCLPTEPDADPGYEVAAATARLVLARGLAASVIVSSFDIGAVDAVRAIDATIPTAWLTVGLPIADAVRVAAERGHPWLHPDRAQATKDPAGAVLAARAAGVRLDVWTVNEPEELRMLADAGFDAVITDVPDIARRALAGD